MKKMFLYFVFCVFCMQATLSQDLELNGSFDLQAPAAIDLESMNQFTISFWLKINSYPGTGIGDHHFLLGEEDHYEVTIQPDSFSPEGFGLFIKKTANNTTSVIENITLGKWMHIVLTVNKGNNLDNYLNGIRHNIGSDDPTWSMPNEPFRIGARAGGANRFDGQIEELRIFNVPLTEAQIRRSMCQKIEQGGVNTIGAITKKEIKDVTANNTVPWSSLVGYYKMDNNLNDSSSNSNTLISNGGAPAYAGETAPIPFRTTTTGGPWTSASTWENASVWPDIYNISPTTDMYPDVMVGSNTATTRFTDCDATLRDAIVDHSAWYIVQIRGDVTTTNSHKLLGLVINPNRTLTVTGNKEININSYLELNGTLNLGDDAQLIQGGVCSDLVTGAAGNILIKQKEGTTNAYWYNYWGSPVGSLATSPLTDNNTTTNNTNNTPFTINMLKNGNSSTYVGGNPVLMQFTTSTEEVGKISDNWLYSMLNGHNYGDWNKLTTSSPVSPGHGYTQKGTGIAGIEQQYVFDGKPNNGTILVLADDVDGDDGADESVGNNLTVSLLGNPYPSALDVDRFAVENEVALRFWQQWAGNSHILASYQGGYAYATAGGLHGSAQQHTDNINFPTPMGLPEPTFFVPVGQGFFVEIRDDGFIEFNNRQRIYKNQNTGETVFFRTNENTSSEKTVESEIQVIKLDFLSSSGALRRFSLGFSDITTDAHDPGYDANLFAEDIMPEDMASLYSNIPYVIQTFSPITASKTIDLSFVTSGNYTYSLDINELKNIDANQEIYLKDNQENVLWDLRQGAYNFTSNIIGQDTERFDIVFQNNTALSNNETVFDNVIIFANNIENKLYIKNLNKQVKSLTLTNMLGQTVKTFIAPENNLLENGVSIGELNSGVYLVNLVLDNNLKLNKKIILE